MNSDVLRTSAEFRVLLLSECYNILIISVDEDRFVVYSG